jgi:hypothetical protein
MSSNINYDEDICVLVKYSSVIDVMAQISVIDVVALIIYLLKYSPKMLVDILSPKGQLVMDSSKIAVQRAQGFMHASPPDRQRTRRTPDLPELRDIRLVEVSSFFPYRKPLSVRKDAF